MRKNHSQNVIWRNKSSSFAAWKSLNVSLPFLTQQIAINARFEKTISRKHCHAAFFAHCAKTCKTVTIPS
jgi:hypothetical protein